MLGADSSTSRLPAALVLLSCLAIPDALTSAAVRPFAADQAATASVSYDAVSRRYLLRAEEAHVVVYTVDLDDADLAQGMLRIEGSVDGRPPLAIVTQAGTRYRSAGDVVLEPEAYAASAGARLIDDSIEAGAVVLTYSEQPGAHLLVKSYRLRLAGLSLAIDFESDSTWGLDGYAGVSLGRAQNPSGSRVATLPYLNEPVALFADGSVMTAYLDPTVSSSVSTSNLVGPGGSGTLYAHGRSLAEPDTAGVAVPLNETAYVTLGDKLADVFPRVTGPGSPYRASLSPRLVLDAWHLHRSFSTPEGVALSWVSTEAGAAHLTLSYRDTNPACGDGVQIIVRHNGTELDRLHVANGQTAELVWQLEIPLAVGDVVRAEIDRAGDNICDSTRLKLVIDTPADLYDSEADFSGTQGFRNWSYLQYLQDQSAPMSWDAGQGRWQGTGAFSLLWQGGGHPGQGPSSYLDARSMVRRYAEYGLRSLAIIFHVWQRWGYDAGLPDHHPADPLLGSGGDLAAFIAEARAAGMLVALHENCTDMYPDAPPDHPSPLWDPDAVALDREGDPILGWFNSYTGQQALRIAVSRMYGFASAEEQAIAADYAPNASYLDVTTAWTPSSVIDHDASDGAVPTLADAYARVVELYDSMKAAYAGPLLGEGGEGPDRFDTYFAGSVDAVERQVERRSRAFVAPDYELLAVKPRMFNHGMGYYSRYFTGAGQVTPSVEQVDFDQYRASEIAFGHAGFLGDSIVGVSSWLRLHAPEYWLMQALQSRYADEDLASALYDDAGTLRDLEGALRAGAPLGRARLLLNYDNGLTVRVNRDASTQIASASGDFSWEQGQSGWRYWEASGNTLTPMAWDPVARRWKGSRPFLLLFENGGHPDQKAAVRTWTVPAATTLRIEGTLTDLDTSCGDGVIGEVRRGPTVLWQCSLAGSGVPLCGPFDLQTPVLAGDEIHFRIEQKSNANCDSTAFPATITWVDGASHDWTVATPDGLRVLPPSGFFADGPGAFRAFTRRDGSAIVDYVAAPEYRFARARDGELRSIEEFLTDGGIAVVPGEFGNELHGLELTRAERKGTLLFQSSVRADFNLRFLDSRRALLVVRDPAPQAPADLTWGDLPAGWIEALAAHPEDLALFKADETGDPFRPQLPVSYANASRPQLAALAADQPYLLRLDSECLADVECMSASCCAGRCVSEPRIEGMLRDGLDVVLSWTGSCPSGYTVRRSIDPTDFSGAAESPAPGTSFRDAGAAATPDNYYYLVE